MFQSKSVTECMSEVTSGYACWNITTFLRSFSSLKIWTETCLFISGVNTFFFFLTHIQSSYLKTCHNTGCSLLIQRKHNACQCDIMCRMFYASWSFSIPEKKKNEHYCQPCSERPLKHHDLSTNMQYDAIFYSSAKAFFRCYHWHIRKNVANFIWKMPYILEPWKASIYIA